MHTAVISAAWAQQAGDERPADLGELELAARVVEHVPVALEQRHVGVHARARVLGERLGHERRVDALLERDLLHREPERHDVVGRAERVGVAQVDLLLAGCSLVVAELHRDAHVLQHRDRRLAEVVRDVVRGVVEVAALVDRPRLGSRLGPLPEQEELDLGVGVEGEARGCAALASARLSTYLGSACDGEPSGIKMSQNIRPTPTGSSRSGISWNVDGSGLAIMSASYTRENPSTADPSKPIPSANAPSSSAGATATDLR